MAADRCSLTSSARSASTSRADSASRSRRLVGDDELGATRQRRAQRDALLLSTGEFRGQSVRAIEEADALEELPCARPLLGAWRGGEPERDCDELLRGELAGEGTPVVLIGVPEDVAPVAAEVAPDACGRSTPATTSEPADGRASPARTRMKVVLPEPLGPRTTQISSSPRPA